MPQDPPSRKSAGAILVGCLLVVGTTLGALVAVASRQADSEPGGSVGKAASSTRDSGSFLKEGMPSRAREGRHSEPRIDHPAAMEYRLRESVRYLASDELEGRGVGTRGIQLAADHIAQQLQQAGLKTDHYQGYPFQRFHRSERTALVGRNTLEIQESDGVTRSLALRRDYTPLSFTANSEFEAPVVFAGYGITAPDAGYDDYATIDVRGKAVIVLRHDPRQADPTSPFQRKQNSSHAHISRKVANAAEHGASAVLLCTDAHTLRKRQASSPTLTPATDTDLAGHDRLLNFHVRGSSGHGLIPVFQVRRDVIETMFAKATANELHDVERQIDETLAPQSRLLDDWCVRGEVQVGKVASDLRNVVATLEGSGPFADETLVLGAHYDHIGYGSHGSLAGGVRAVHNGADDNASGTALVLEVARQLASRPDPLPRRILFIAFTAEEIGLVGSQYYAAHPLVPHKQTIAMLNLDMVGWLRGDRLEVFGTGTAVEFKPLLSELGERHSLRILSHPSGYGPSDHAPFFERGIPVLHFFTGFHDHYHRPSDDVERLNLTGMRRITELIRDLIVELANSADRPQMQRTEDFDLLASLTEGLELPKYNTRPNLGVRGEYDPASQGYVIHRLLPGGLARRHGFRPGDRIIRIDTRDVTSAEDLREAVDALKPGERVPFLLSRGGIELEVAVAVD